MAYEDWPAYGCGILRDRVEVGYSLGVGEDALSRVHLLCLK